MACSSLFIGFDDCWTSRSHSRLFPDWIFLPLTGAEQTLFGLQLLTVNAKPGNYYQYWYLTYDFSH
jgi:hypothetical protein